MHCFLHWLRGQPHLIALAVVCAAILPGIAVGATPPASGTTPPPLSLTQFGAHATHMQAHAADRADVQIRVLQHAKHKLTQWGRYWHRKARHSMRAYQKLLHRLGGYMNPARYVGPITERGRVVVALAQHCLGVPYVWGGASPSGFDCSGLVKYVYARVGISLAHAATIQQHASRAIRLSALQPGDLVFYGNAYRSYHVAIFVGNGRTIEAPHAGAVVRYGSVAGAWVGGTFFH